MGSVSSLIASHNLQEKQCGALDYCNRKASHPHKLSRQLDGLLTFDTGHQGNSKGPKTNSKCEKSQDFFYISVSQSEGLRKTGRPRNGASELEPQRGSSALRDGQGTPASPVLLPRQLDKRSEKSVARTTVMKVALSGTGSAHSNHPSEGGKLAFQGNVLKPVKPLEKHNSEEEKLPNYSGTLSDSGRNSMMNLPAHSAGYGRGADQLGAAKPLSRLGGSVQHVEQVTRSLDSVLRNVASNTPTSETGHCPTSTGPNPNQSQLLSQSAIHTPLSADKDASQEGEGRLEGKGAGLEGSRAEEEMGYLGIYAEKQEDGYEPQMDSATDSRACQRAQRNLHQLLQLQLTQLQQDKTKLQEDFTQLLQDHRILNAQYQSYQREHAELAPKLEETKWEVCQKSGEISLLKQQLKDSQGALTQRVSEALSLKAQLKEARLKLSAREGTVGELQSSLQVKERELGVCENEQQRAKNAAEMLRGKVSQLEGQILDLQRRLAGCKGAERTGQADSAVPHTDREIPRRQGPLESPPGTLAAFQAQLEQEKLRNRELAIEFQRERLLWRAEKRKVIEYQRKLQRNYIDVVRQNHSLERTLQQVSTELGAREPAASGIQRADIHYEEIIATAI
ncbi:leucine zipper putative tumor suppressor 1-like [Mustelus asterias]